MNREQIFYYAVKYKGEWIQITKAIKYNEPWSPVDYKGNYITLCDKEYPAKFKELQNPPWIFFYEGDLAYLDEPCITIAGMQRSDIFGKQRAGSLVDDLKKYTLISGISKGIQTEAYRRADKAVLVLGSGLNVPYPLVNESLINRAKNDQLVITEYPEDARPLAFHFPWRNRLIAALSDEVYIMETTKYSSTMMLAKEAILLGRDVYALPHPYDAEFQKGYQLLISEGAKDYDHPERIISQTMV